MKTIYDISMLGSGYYLQKARTGISRVIENVALKLSRSKECELVFCSFNTFEQYIQSCKYLQAIPELGNIAICRSDSKLLNEIEKVIERLYPAPGLEIRRRVVSFFVKRLNALNKGLDQDVLNDADIFHSTFYPLPDYLGKYGKLKRFITIYDLIPIIYPQYFEVKKDHLLHKILASIGQDGWVAAISHSTRNDLCNYLKIDPSRVFVTHLAASDAFYHCTDPNEIATARRKYGIPDGPYVLSLSTLEPRKNIDHTIRCFARMVQEQHITDLNLVLVGTKGWDYDRIFAEISQLSSMKERIVVTGYVADEDLAALYSGAMMFAYPSLYEGFGLPPLEAMQCGVPVITSNTSSLPEVVGDAGFMVDPADGDALCQSMLELYRKPSLRQSMSVKSSERARLFSWEKCAQDTITAYESALRG